MKDNLGTVLQKLRKEANLTAKDVAEKLQIMGYPISDKTLSGYETGIRMPNADVFMALCQIYNCKNILEIFSFVKAGYSIPTDEEWSTIEKYRLLDEYGKETVRIILDREVERVKQINRLEVSEEFTPTRIISYYQRLASAGAGEFLFNDIPTDTIEVLLNDISRQADFVIGINGRSMETSYYDGEKVFIKKTPDVNYGEIGLFIANGNCYIKELGHNELISQNEDKETYPNIKPDENGIKIIGKVIGKVDEG